MFRLLLISPACCPKALFNQLTIHQIHTKRIITDFFFPGPPQGKNIHINPHFRPPPGGRGMPDGKEHENE